MLNHMADRYTIISADCHAGANHVTYREYLADEWKDEFDAWRGGYKNPFRDLQDDGRSRNWDDDRRISEMDADGVIAEVVFPNTVPPFFPTGQVVAPAPKNDDDFPKRLAGLHAHNRWLADFVAAFPKRRAGLGQIFLNDVDQAVTDVRWMKDHGLAGVLLPGVSPDTPWIEPLYSPIYDPLWAVCQELEMPVTHHSGGSGIPNYGRYPFTNALFVMETGFFANRALWHLMLSGVFDRFPDMKLVLTEQGSQWVPNVLDRMDALWERMSGGRIGELDVPDGAVTKKKASEYWATNCYLGASFPGPEDAALFESIGLDTVMWGSDYPHNEGTYPKTRESLRAAFSGWDEKNLRRIFSENIAKVYGFDLEALAPIAAEVGPTVEEIATPVAG
ncbi:MAG: putative TIM-barrel fold metal-dependent hydrolase [Acidimicrobiales bacterium]|nr:putative TIM-barrel fold metal-dependent hydrolase [Acidimicrobiales bacterium]